MGPLEGFDVGPAAHGDELVLICLRCRVWVEVWDSAGAHLAELNIAATAHRQGCC